MRTAVLLTFAIVTAPIALRAQTPADTGVMKNGTVYPAGRKR